MEILGVQEAKGLGKTGQEWEGDLQMKFWISVELVVAYQGFQMVRDQ